MMSGGASFAETHKILKRYRRTASLLAAPTIDNEAGLVKYEGHSDKLVNRVGELEKDAINEEDRLIADEQKAQQEHDKYVLQKQLEIGTKEKNLERTEERKAD